MVLRKVVTPAPTPYPSSTTTPPPKQPHDYLPVPNPMPSYWLQNPHPYATLRSTPSLPPTCDIAIIGSGMAGVLTLYHILQNAHKSHLATGKRMPRVVLLDARDLCSGATARNGGHSKIKTATLAGMQDSALRTEMADYHQRVIYELKSLVEDEGLAQECEFELRRSFDVFQDSEEFEKVKRVFDDAVEKGEEWTKSRSVVEGRYVEGVTSVKGAVGAFTCEVASFWPYKLVTGVLEGLVGRFGGKDGEGVLNVQMNTPVTHLTTSSTSSTSPRNTTTTTLHTPRGTLTTTSLIHATNAYTPSLLPSFTSTIVPYKGMNSHHTPSHRISPHLSHTYNISFAPTKSTPTTPSHPTGTDYLNPRPDSTIVVGGGSWLYTHSSTPHNKSLWYNTVDDSLTSGHFPPHIYSHWTSYMSTTFLGWENSAAQPDSIWTGIQAQTTDGMPHVGRVPGVKEGQWMLCGFNGGGMGIIPVVARAVAKMVVEGKGFEDVEGEFGLVGGFATGEGRMV